MWELIQAYLQVSHCGEVITCLVESALKMGLWLAAQYNGWQVYMEVVDFEFASCCRSPRILFAVACKASYMYCK